MLKKSAWLLYQIGGKAPPAARTSNEAACALNPRTGNGEHGWCLSSSLFLSVGFSIQDEAMDVALSAPQGLTTIRPLFTCFLKKGHGVYVTPGWAYTNSVPNQHSLYPSVSRCFLFQIKPGSVLLVQEHLATDKVGDSSHP